MTRQDRELAIADNISYVRTSIEAVSAEWPVKPVLVLAGFSQGVAMAFRAAANWARESTGVLAVGGDVPPDLDSSSLKSISASLIGRGTADEWYTKEKFAEDERRLSAACRAVRAIEFAGGHEWPAEFNEAASNFLGEFARR
jgi:predicted esterase